MIEKIKKLINLPNLLIVYLIAFYIFIRLFNLTSGLTVDEPHWITRSKAFYYALSKLDLDATYQAPHPGVLTMYTSGLGLAAEKILQPLMPVQQVGKALYKADLLFARTSLFVFQTLCLIIIFYLLAFRFKNYLWAIFSLTLLTFEPYIIRLSRIVHVDTVFVYPLVIAVLFLLLFSETRNKKDFLASFFFFTLSILNKTPATFFLPFSLLVLISTYGYNWKKSLNLWISGSIISLLLFLILWPKMWVDPLSAIKNMFSVISSPAFI